ncbi:YggS family pyridoxal phosphate-dependent enzyme [Peptacetobacter sp.]|uniref:YggS family pyridoxal phosphate-dependent enzyme n=1 Tax=Peptacetobacter sp. TaxID=2991975 RepID=UPI0026390A9F|nr:YggS family pyridoxal phosphate-dependent enzyme [Peptacetobacter sp.]
MENIRENIENIRKRIADAAQRVGRDTDDIKLISVTKTVDIDKVEEAIEAGSLDAGENKPQELARKYDVLGNKIRWHQIGSLQTNKVKYIIDKVCMIHSLDREGLAEEIDKRASKINRVIDCLVQVNISGEESKHGMTREEVEPFIRLVSEKYHNIKIKGLMTMAPFDAERDEIRKVFRNLKELSEEINNMNIENVDMTELSMGMTNDFEIAIEEGATMVRVGTAIFGKRNYNK